MAPLMLYFEGLPPHFQIFWRTAATFSDIFIFSLSWITTFSRESTFSSNFSFFALRVKNIYFDILSCMKKPYQVYLVFLRLICLICLIWFDLCLVGLPSIWVLDGNFLSFKVEFESQLSAQHCGMYIVHVPYRILLNSRQN